MSLDHKAYPLNFERFDAELRPVLEASLTSGELAPLEAFIDANIGTLVDPYEGERLEDGWQSMLGTIDAHQLGDFALTKYYDPLGELGLGEDWQRVRADVGLHPETGLSPVLGRSLGPDGAPFDPGKMGSYFQTSNDVAAHLSWLIGESDRPEDDDLVSMLKAAGAGLYVTF